MNLQRLWQKKFSTIVFKKLVFGFCLCFILACNNSKEILSSLNSRQSIQSMVVLADAGISVQREKTGQSGKGEKFSLFVPENQYLHAIRLVNEYNLPKTQDTDIEVCTSRQGFVPNPPELSSLRLDIVLEKKIEQMLNDWIGVLDSRAIVRSNFRIINIDKKESEPPSASVIIRYMSQSGVPSFTINEAKELVSQVVPGLLPENITINTIRVQIPSEPSLYGRSLAEPSLRGPVPLVLLNPLLRFYVPEAEKTRLLSSILLYLLLFCVSGLLIGFIWGSVRTSKKGIKKNLAKGNIVDVSTTATTSRGTGNIIVTRESSKESVGEER